MSKSPFDVAKKSTATTKKPKGAVLIAEEDVAEQVDLFAQAVDEIKANTGVKNYAKGIIEDWAMEQYIDLCMKEGKKPDSPTIQGKKHSLKLIVMDKYSSFDPDEPIDKEVEEHIEELTTFEFNNDVLERNMEKITSALQAVLSKDDLENLLVAKVKKVAKAGTIERLIATSSANLIPKVKVVAYVR